MARLSDWMGSTTGLAPLDPPLLTLMYIPHNVTVDATAVVDAFVKR